MPVPPPRAGFALPLVIALLAVGGALALALFLLARMEFQSGDNSLSAARAFEAAEAGLGETFGWWDPVQYNQLAESDSMVLPPVTRGRSGFDVSLTRLSVALFQVRSAGWYQPFMNLPPARRELRALARVESELPGIPGALAVLDTVQWDATSRALGFDTIPPGWSGRCTDTAAAIAGLAVSPTSATAPAPCATCLMGMPPFIADTAVHPGLFTGLGSGGYAALAAQATHRISGAPGLIGPVVGGTPSRCLLDSLNWGEPAVTGPFAPCAGHFPVIHSPGHLLLTGGRGQGTLLVDGDLEIGGGFTFLGVVVVRGKLKRGAGGGTVLGAVLAQGLDFTNPASGQLDLHYSACVLPLASRGSSLGFPLRNRGWHQAY